MTAKTEEKQDKKAEQLAEEKVEELLEEKASDEPNEILAGMMGADAPPDKPAPEPDKEPEEEPIPDDADEPQPETGASRAMVELARSVGVSDDAIRALGSDDALRFYLQERMQKGAEVAPGGDTRTGPELVDEFNPFDFDVVLDSEQYDEGMVKYAESVKKMKEHNDKYLSSLGRQVRAMQETMVNVNNYFAQQQAQQDQQWFEGQVKQLVNEEPGLKDVFGATSWSELKSPKHQAAWQEVWDEVSGMAPQNAKRTRPLTPDQLFKRAVYAVHGDKLKTIARKALAAQDQQAAEEYATAMPTARKDDATMHPRDRSKQRVAEFMRKKSMT